MSKVILEALGVEDEVQALRAIAEFTNFLDEVRAATGRDKFGEALVVVRQNADIAKQVVALTEKPVAESTGVILAWKSAYDMLPTAQAENVQLKDAIENRDRAELIEQGLAEHKLTPASVDKHWNEKDEHGRYKRSAVDLRSFLDSAPRIIPAALKQPNAPQGTGPVAGKDYGEMSSMEKHELRGLVGEDTFQQIRADYYERTNQPMPRS